MHKQRCRILEGLNDDTLEIVHSNLETDSPLDDTKFDSQVDMSFDHQDIAITKPGIMLPKKGEQWNLANDYFKSVFIDFDFNSNSIDLMDESVCLINNFIYNYFRDHYEMSEAT